MIYEFEYKTSEEKAVLMETNKDKYLIKVQETVDGNFLTFTDVKPIELTLEELRKDNLTTFDVLATMYEELMTKGSV